MQSTSWIRGGIFFVVWMMSVHTADILAATENLIPALTTEETKTLQTRYDTLVAEGKMPKEGFVKIVDAISKSKLDAEFLLVSISEENEVLLLHRLDNEKLIWVLSHSVLLRKRPEYKAGFNADKYEQLRPLLQYYGSEWIRKQVQDGVRTTGKVRLSALDPNLLESASPPFKKSNGNLLYETGPAQIGGLGLGIEITPTGDLVSVNWLFNPE
jgi:hypothetical protein